MSKPMTNDECWAKFQFRRSCEQKHPIYDEKMYFEGLEADYVGRLEREIEFLKDAYNRLREKLDWMTTQEMYRMRDELKKKTPEPSSHGPDEEK